MNVKCCKTMDVRKDHGNYLCISCGNVFGIVHTHYENFERNCYDYLKDISTHSRTRWFKNKIMDFVHDDRDRNKMNDQFQTLIRCYETNDILEGARNIGVYDYFIGALARLNNVTLIKPLRKIKSSKTRKEYDRKFKKACNILGWDFELATGQKERSALEDALERAASEQCDTV